MSDLSTCIHCHVRIYRSAATGRWLHSGNLDNQCFKAMTNAEPRQEDK